MQKHINKKFKPVEVQDNFRFQDIIDYHFKLKSFTNLIRKMEKEAMIILPLCTTIEKLSLRSLLDCEIQD